MTEKRFWRLIALAAALGLGVCAALAAWPGLIELPFKLPCGYFVDLLWDISKTGAVWRILAIILYVLVCLVPAGALFLISRRRRPWREDWLLALLSVVLLLLVGRALDRDRAVYSTFAQMGLLAVLVTWLALRLLRYFSVSDDRRLVRLVRIVVVLIGMLFAALAGVSAFAILASLFERFTIPALAEGAGSVASSCITVYGCLLGLRLVDSLGEGGELTDDTVDLARGFYRYSVRAASAILLISLAANLVKLVFVRVSSSTDVSVNFPVFQLLFCLAALIVSRFIAAHKELRDDNDLFV
ncbi:MAG TPA: hypothetical protein IAD42_07945 [Candidatus Scatomorpha pullistercoris]|uniref:DUF2975 domain-containing protein n=1 Tax=Candidatus Scatomorpha pullistercoris TaxID=2840929 RepID=A0A9D1G730_9FIRM|nr:hypothetical protein [Candidatus Scatomorpha pullistercoris]